MKALTIVIVTIIILTGCLEKVTPEQIVNNLIYEIAALTEATQGDISKQSGYSDYIWRSILINKKYTREFFEKHLLKIATGRAIGNDIKLTNSYGSGSDYDAYYKNYLIEVDFKEGTEFNMVTIRCRIIK